MNIEKSQLELIVREIIKEKLCSSGVKQISLPHISVSEADRLDTKNPNNRVYTKDVLSISESPRLGCGVMEMTDTTFDWTLKYDEIDYVIDGTLNIVHNNKTFTATRGEVIYIPKGSDIQFSVNGFARFMYVTYPANWAEL